jgi:hypothetical protein
VGFDVHGTSAVDVADVNGDGFPDVAFAVHSASDVVYSAESPVFLGSAWGMRTKSFHTFPTTGAHDVLLRDLNGDGHIDAVFAQEQDGSTYGLDSTLFWGSAQGWNTTPDVTFSTYGASDVEAADIDDDGNLDLVFACYRDDSSTIIDSMVFLQDANGFCGTAPSHRLATKGARAVAVGDLDEDGHLDLVFANALSGGFSEIDSLVYMGEAGGGFSSAVGVPTSGAHDVKAADVDEDGDLDLVFANFQDNTGDHMVDSYVYLNDGSGGFGRTPHHVVPTTGAVAVTVADLDGTGWKDLVLACHQSNATNYSVPSMVFLGGASGWSSSPAILLPTEGASGVMATHLYEPGRGGYMSKAITPEDPRNTGTFHTLRYECYLGTSGSGRIQIVDASSKEVLTESHLREGENEWPLEGEFYFKEHQSIRVVVSTEDLAGDGSFWLDDLWLNWSRRTYRPPQILGLEVSESSVYRLQSVDLWVNVTDEYDLPGDLTVKVEHALNGTSDWETYLLDSPEYAIARSLWKVPLRPLVTAEPGVYDLRVMVTDEDGEHSEWVVFPEMVAVLNNLPTTPEIRIDPKEPKATSTLSVVIERSATDVESSAITYRFLWSRDGEPVEDQTGETIPSHLLRKGQNWSVEVRAFDGDDEGPPALAWVVILNTPPVPKEELPDPAIEEDTVDTNWLDLTNAFEDVDGDALTWSLQDEPIHIDVTIDPDTGIVTLAPEADWFGDEVITFVASDGEATASQTVMILVTSVNDIPVIAIVDGEAITSDLIEYTIKVGEELVIAYEVSDVEGDEVLASINTSVAELDEEAGEIRFTPDEAGTLWFALRIWDVESPDVKVTLEFLITIEPVEHVNRPMSDPTISRPGEGATFEVDEVFTLLAVCTDPDEEFGQVLNYSWASNLSGHLGYGSSLSLHLQDAGTHVITLTVSDGEFQKTATVTIVVKPIDVQPPPPPNGGDEDGQRWLPWVALVAVLFVVGALFYVLSTRGREEEVEPTDVEMEEESAPDIDGGKAEEQVAEEVKAPPTEAKDIEVETDSVPQGQLSMEATVTEAPSADTARLFTTAAAEPAMTEDEREQLRIDNLKRKYQNAIGRLPYGIPSKELADRDWVDLASALATGEKRTSPEGQELTEIDGRWYYSDVEDTGTFLKEHGAKREEPKKAEVAPADKTALLAKLEERFILGEISEEAYMRLVEKYSEEE